MKRLAQLAPFLAITALMTAGSSTGFNPRVMLMTSLASAAYLAWGLAMKKREGRMSPIDLGLGAYVAAHALAWSLLPGLAAFLAAWPSPALYLILLLVASLPQLLGREPFTTHFARRTTPEAVWGTGLFRDINLTMSWVWAGVFLAAGLTSLIPNLLDMQGQLTLSLFRIMVPMVFVLGIGLPFNLRYPAYAQRKAGLDPAGLSMASQPQPPAPAGPHASTPDAKPIPKPKETVMSERPTVVALNGSPHAGMGNTAQMIEMLRPELEAQGLDLEVILLAGKNIEYCQGCGFCMEKGRCWIPDDHRAITDRLLAAEAVILASPCYFFHVTAQMKTFLDRCLALGHKPRPSWKPGLAISVAASVGEVETADYLGAVLKPFGAFSVGSFTALATNPGGFMGKQAVEQRARDLARDLAVAVKEKRRYPATGRELIFFQFMSALVTAEKDRVMKDDYEHWKKCGFIDGGFPAYVGQEWTEAPYDDAMRQAWIKQMIAEYKAGNRPNQPAAPPASAPASGPQAASTCRQLLEMMPLGFNAAAAGDLKAVYQFEVSEEEEFTAYLRIADGSCVFVEGQAAKPDVTIKTPAGVWLAIAKGKLDGQAAFMGGRYKVQGNLALLMRLKELFGN